MNTIYAKGLALLLDELKPSSPALEKTAGLFRVGDEVYQYIPEARSLWKTALQVGSTKNVNGVTYTLNQNHRWTKAKDSAKAAVGRLGQTVSTKVQQTKQQVGKVGHAVIHEGDHLGQNVVSWKTGQVIGGAIATYAISHGANPVAATIISQSVVQAGTATALYVAQSRKKGKPLSAQKIGAQFVNQVAGAYLGKYAHHGTEWALENLGVKHVYEQVGAMVAGKVTGIKTTQEVARMHVDSRLTMAAIGLASGSVGLVAKHMAGRSGMVFKSADQQLPPELANAYWRLYQLGIAIALHKQNQNSQSLRKSADNIKKVLPWWGLEIGIEKEPGDLRHGRKMKAGYGHIRGSYGDAEDGMSLDVYIGPDLGSHELFKVKQINPETGELDEYKLIIGCWSLPEAKQLYLSHMPEKFFGGIDRVGLRSQLGKYQRRSLRKAAKKKTSPGQISLFDELKHPRDSEGKFIPKHTAQDGFVDDEDEQAFVELDTKLAAQLQGQISSFLEDAHIVDGEVDRETVIKIEQFSEKLKRQSSSELKKIGIDLEESSEWLDWDELDEAREDVIGEIFDRLDNKKSDRSIRSDTSVDAPKSKYMGLTMAQISELTRETDSDSIAPRFDPNGGPLTSNQADEVIKAAWGYGIDDFNKENDPSGIRKHKASRAREQLTSKPQKEGYYWLPGDYLQSIGLMKGSNEVVSHKPPKDAKKARKVLDRNPELKPLYEKVSNSYEPMIFMELASDPDDTKKQVTEMEDYLEMADRVAQGETDPDGETGKNSVFNFGDDYDYGDRGDLVGLIELYKLAVSNKAQELISKLSDDDLDDFHVAVSELAKSGQQISSCGNFEEVGVPTTITVKGVPYMPVCKPSGWVLIKASRQAPPGQMSLFGGDNGPKEGDTKPGASGNTLTLRGGRWKDESKESGIAQQPKQVLPAVESQKPKPEQNQTQPAQLKQTETQDVNQKASPEDSQSGDYKPLGLNLKNIDADPGMDNYDGEGEPPPFVPSKDLIAIANHLKTAHDPEFAYEFMSPDEHSDKSLERREAQALKDIKVLNTYGINDFSELSDLKFNFNISLEDLDANSKIPPIPGAKEIVAELINLNIQGMGRDLALELLTEYTPKRQQRIIEKEYADEPEFQQQLQKLVANPTVQEAAKKFRKFDPERLTSGEHEYAEFAVNTLKDLRVGMHPEMRAAGKILDRTDSDRAVEWLSDQIYGN